MGFGQVPVRLKYKNVASVCQCGIQKSKLKKQELKSKGRWAKSNEQSSKGEPS